MMVSHPVRYSFAEYVAHEKASNVKHEYYAGQIYAMAGGSPEHSALIATLAGQLSSQVRGGPCRVHMADLRIQVREPELTTYPDITVICGPWERHPADPNTILNPTLLVEVLSPSTEAYDRGDKLQHYKQVPTLRAVLLVATERQEVEIWFRREGEAWSRALVNGGRLALDAISAELDIDAAYEDAREPEAS
jgi:Uma2 family endonuclease